MHDQSPGIESRTDGVIKLKGDLLKMYKDPIPGQVPRVDPSTFSKIGSVHVLQEQASLHTHKVFPTRLEVHVPKNAGLSADDELTYITHVDGCTYYRGSKTCYSYWVYAACPRQRCFYMLLVEFEVAKFKAR